MGNPRRVFGRPGLILDGTTPVNRRPEIVAEFQDDNGPPFMVLTLKAGGSGLNLTAATHVVHFDLWWNPATEAQATDRAHRIGQKRQVMVHRMVCRGTLEEGINDILRIKREVAEDLLAPEDEEVALTRMGTTNCYGCSASIRSVLSAREMSRRTDAGRVEASSGAAGLLDESTRTPASIAAIGTFEPP